APQQGLVQDLAIVTGRHTYYFPPRLAPAPSPPGPFTAHGFDPDGQRSQLTIHPQQAFAKAVVGGVAVPLELLPGDFFEWLHGLRGAGLEGAGQRGLLGASLTATGPLPSRVSPPPPRALRDRLGPTEQAP